MQTESIYAKLGNDPYKTCDGCVVKDWCDRRNGTKPLPNRYELNSECGGYIMLERAIELSNLPREYRNANLRSFDVDSDNDTQYPMIELYLKNAVDAVKNGVNIAFIHHNKGTGKSFSACALTNEFIYKTCTNPEWFDYENPVALYVKFGDWCNEIRRAHQEQRPEAFELMYSKIDQMKKVPLLVLDDIGSGRITDVIRDLTYDVIDKRKEEQKSTIYTSNFVDSILSQDDRLGEIIVSRMMYRTIVIDLGGRDRRMQYGV